VSTEHRSLIVALVVLLEFAGSGARPVSHTYMRLSVTMTMKIGGTGRRGTKR
jgi:hypothetical protein